jgi:hypothetical protein
MKSRNWAALSCCFSLLCLCGLSGALADDDPITRLARLQHVRSLRCTYDTEATTAYMPEGRRITTDHDTLMVVYDDIDLRHGTARVVYLKGVAPAAGDVSVRWNGNALWFTEIPQSTAAVSNAIMTTVFASYARGTEDFIALDSRQSLAVTVAGSMASGTCTELR